MRPSCRKNSITLHSYLLDLWIFCWNKCETEGAHQQADRGSEDSDDSSCPTLLDWDSSIDTDEDVLLPICDVLSSEEYKSVNAIFAAYGRLSLHDLDRASAPVLPPRQEPPHL
jgi:hypothetical protein